MIGKPLDAEITLYLTPEAKAEYADALAENLPPLFIVSKVIVADSATNAAESEIPGISVGVRASDDKKCVRCWTHNEHVGKNSEHPELCPRCAEALS